MLSLVCWMLVGLVVGSYGAPSSPEFSIPNYPGPCPDLQVASNYDVEKTMEGVWYQVYATTGDEVHQNDSTKCIERRYTYTSGNSNLRINKYSLIDRRPVWSDSSLIVTDTPGIYLHSRNVGPWYYRVEIKAVISVPDSHLLMWGCMYDNKTNTHYESGGISSRRRHLSNENYQSILKVLSDGGASIKFFSVDWSDCRARCE